MKLGIGAVGFGPRVQINMEMVLRAEELGFDSAWTAEAWGNDAVTTASWLLAQTSKIKVGTSIMQMPARQPAMAAMTAMSLDHLSGGRFILGIGVSGPQVVEGWYGQPWGKPYWRIRDYVSIMRKIFEREAPAAHEGKEISLPYSGEGAMGVGKPLKSILHMNPNIPIWLGTGSESNVRLTAEIADGWFPLAFVPGMMDLYTPWLEEGFRRAGGGKSLADFEIQPMISVRVTDHVGQALERMKPGVALYVGGMGHRDKNFHNDMMVRRGYPEAAEKIQELYLAGLGLDFLFRQVANSLPVDGNIFYQAADSPGVSLDSASEEAIQAAPGPVQEPVAGFGSFRVGSSRDAWFVD